MKKKKKMSLKQEDSRSTSSKKIRGKVSSFFRKTLPFRIQWSLIVRLFSPVSHESEFVRDGGKKDSLSSLPARITIRVLPNPKYECFSTNANSCNSCRERREEYDYTVVVRLFSPNTKESDSRLLRKR